ncbi:uncharacterized protein LOC131874165 [Cryptomeria japonica]|uniref:uncharacterized protein LOC131874165 n=1 Tax=Cryptomeria japonica TaxID=3369 RepID=UPI0027DA97A6|nr:uncharacterized protein LOC131874165 [Cryptomeria japonica]
MEQLLSTVAGSEMFSMLDGFLGYNQTTKLIHGRGICENIVWGYKPREDELAAEEAVMFSPDAPQACWIEARKQFMKAEIFPDDLPSKKRRFYRFQKSGFRLIDRVLFKRNFDGILLCCVDRSQADKILHEFHYGSSRGYFSAPTTVIKITQAGYFWSSMLKAAHNLIRECKEC